MTSRTRSQKADNVGKRELNDKSADELKTTAATTV
jgi:hypothetical protein